MRILHIEYCSDCPDWGCELNSNIGGTLIPESCPLEKAIPQHWRPMCMDSRCLNKDFKPMTFECQNCPVRTNIEKKVK
jgi:hypothetical protein